MNEPVFDVDEYYQIYATYTGAKTKQRHENVARLLPLCGGS